MATHTIDRLVDANGNEFVFSDSSKAEAGTASPLMDRKASVGNSLKYAREDHVHPSDTSREDIANKTTVVLGTSDSKYPTDKAVAEFVNSSIATNTANYISNNGEPFTSVEQLEAYSGPVTNNDYAFVTGTDSEGNTYYDRYKATVSGETVTWALEYRLNNSSFTAAQWSAINSGITSALVAKIHEHENKAVLDGITSSDVANWNSKMDRQTVGNVSEPVYLENGIAKVATNVATKTETEEAISNSVDQTYSSTSTKAQSGVAVNEAFKTRETSTSDDSYTYLGMKKNYGGEEELYWKLVSFNTVKNYWTLQFEIDVSNGSKSNGSYDTEIYETKRLTICGKTPGSLAYAKVLRYAAQGLDSGRGYANNIYYEIGSSNLFTVYIKAANYANKTQICRLKDVISFKGISNITWYEPAADAGTQPTNPVKFKEFFPAIASLSSNIGSDSVPVYINKGKPVSCNSSNLKAGKDDDGNVIKNTYQKKLTFDTTPTAGSTNPVTSGGIKNAIDSAAGSATAKNFTGYNTSNIVTGSWYIIALKNGGASEWERLYEFLIGSNDNSAEQMRVLFSPRISANGGFDDSKVFISGHIIKNTSLLANWKFATLKDTAGTTYTALCVKGTNSTSSRSVYWNVRSVRGNNDWKPVSINLDTTQEYTIVSELPFNGASSLPNCITTDSISLNTSGNEFNASLPITSGAMFGYLTNNVCKPSKAITLSSGGANITQTGGSWTSTWRQNDCMLNGNGMLDVTADFGINIINQHTYVAKLTGGTCALCDWNGNVVASANFNMPKHIDNTLVYTVTDNVSLRFVVPACASNFNNGLKVVITLPSDYTIDSQVNISDFTLRGTYWRNGTGYNSNAIIYDS